ncbi:MAG: hypothetical protein D6690_15700 [Nitrospirae bacterium]|nr:MAG: hypothetical protein D6690_15700 [Nitrospirota bacterium]
MAFDCAPESYRLIRQTGLLIPASSDGIDDWYDHTRQESLRLVAVDTGEPPVLHLRMFARNRLFTKYMDLRLFVRTPFFLLRHTDRLSTGARSSSIARKRCCLAHGFQRPADCCIPARIQQARLADPSPVCIPIRLCDVLSRQGLRNGKGQAHRYPITFETLETVWRHHVFAKGPLR